MDSIEFLDFAKKVISEENSGEIDFRQAVSRSYYCAFHKVREKSLSFGVPVDAYKGGVHKSLRDTLIHLRPENKTMKGIAFKLNNFHILRVDADYRLELDVTQSTANESIKMCESILSMLESVKSL